MTFLNQILFNFGVVLLSCLAMAEPDVKAPLSMRIISTTSCRYCEALKQSLLKKGHIKESVNGVYYKGEITVQQGDVQKKVPIEFIEVDQPKSSTLRLSPQLDYTRANGVPHLQSYLGNQTLVEAPAAALAQELNVYYDPKDSGTAIVGIANELQQALEDEGHRIESKPTSQAYKAPKRLISNNTTDFSSLPQICEDSRKNHPTKKLALAVVKTHLCDTGTLVCLKTASLISDPANKFVQDNFSVYETRFIRQGTLIADSGERQIRKNFGKADSNPQYYVIDVNKCEIIFNDYGYNAGDGMFATNDDNRIDFGKNYIALRKFLLGNTRVAEIIGPQYTNNDNNQIRTELQYATDYHRKNPQLNLFQIRQRIEKVDHELGLDASRSIPSNYPQNLGDGSGTL